MAMHLPLKWKASGAQPAACPWHPHRAFSHESSYASFRTSQSCASFRTSQSIASFRTSQSSASFRTSQCSASFRTSQCYASFRTIPASASFRTIQFFKFGGTIFQNWRLDLARRFAQAFVARCFARVLKLPGRSLTNPDDVRISF